MKYEEAMKELKAMADSKNAEGMARFGISGEDMYGVSMPNIRKLGKKIGNNHELALKLWNSGIHEARILAGIVEEPEKVTAQQMDRWIKDFDSWDVCDQVCMNLFWKMDCAYNKAKEWTKLEPEFERRSGFALMAVLAWKDKEASDIKFEQFFPIIKRESTDERNFVKKAVNWALRQIGKKNSNLNKKAIGVAKEIQKIDSKAAKWVANNALTELEGKAVQKRLRS